jgi:2'-5' RNA ligase
MKTNNKFEKHKNLFIAIEIFPDDIFLDLYNKVVASVTKFGRIIWIKSERMYLVLKYLGEVPIEKTPDIIEKII